VAELEAKQVQPASTAWVPDWQWPPLRLEAEPPDRTNPDYPADYVGAEYNADSFLSLTVAASNLTAAHDEAGRYGLMPSMT
jgi:hypothetical protein